MTRIYASPADLPEAYQEDARAEDFIRRASNLVTRAIRNARFETDSEGMPLGDDLAACRDAVVIHVSTWFSTGVDPVAGIAGMAREVASKGTNGSTVAYVQDSTRTAYLNLLAQGVDLTPSALMPLEAQGLLDTWLVGSASSRLYNPVPSPDILIDGGEG